MCKRCKVSIDKFAAFSCKVVQTQKKLCKDPAGVTKKASTGPNGTKSDEKINPHHSEVDSNATGDVTDGKEIQEQSKASEKSRSRSPTSSQNSEEPNSKKTKLDDSFEDDLLQEVTFQEIIPEENKSVSKVVLLISQLISSASRNQYAILKKSTGYSAQ